MRRPALVLSLLAALVLAGHLPFTATTLEDIDSVNFALGIRDFDPAQHRPHPPGYPLFMAVPKAATALLEATGSRPAGTAEATTLSLLAIVAAAASVFPLFVIYRGLERSHPVEAPDTGARALAAVVLACAWPLAWFTAVRPMSDTVGLAAALAAQACLVAAFTWRTQDQGRRDQLLMIGAAVAGLAIGVRSQTVWLTFPMLALALLSRRGPGARRTYLTTGGALAAGVLAWGVPLVLATGGPAAYLAALGGQAGEDVVGVDMLALNPNPRLLAAGLWHTLVLPAGWVPLGIVLVTLAVLGAARLALTARRAALLLSVLAGPYLLYHLLWQETITTRYALPLVPALAYLVLSALASVQRGWLMALPLAAVCLAAAVPATRAFAAGSPTSTIVREVSAARRGSPGVALGMHFVFARPLEAESPGLPQLAAPNGREWLALVEHWRRGGGPVWFLGDPTRTDLALIDPASQLVRHRASWPRKVRLLLHGHRPSSVEWIEMRPPGWMLGEGWSLTPETAGRARRDGRGLQAGPIEGYVRGRPEPVTVLLGGRHLGAPGDPSGHVELRFGADVVDRFEAKPGPFTRLLRGLKVRAAVGEYGRLSVRAASASGARVPIAVEQFDLQDPAERPIFGFDEGWHELEHDRRLERLFRWSSGRAVLQIAAERDSLLTLGGESPGRYFEGVTGLRVRADAEVLGAFLLHDDFVVRVRLPAAALARAGGRVVIETDRTFVPAERGGSGDRRTLGVRFFRIDVAYAN